MKKISLFLMSLAIMASANTFAACALYFKTEKLCLDAKWETMAARNKPGSMILTFTDVTNPERIISPVNSPSVLLWMPSMGHGSKPITVTLIEDGKYRATNILFIMPGAWDIRYQLKDGDKVVEELIQKINI